MQEITLVYPNQLFPAHPAIRPGRPVWLIEDPLFFGNDSRWPAAMHAQKILLHRASMQAYAEELRAAGHTIRTLGFAEPFDPPASLQAIHLAEPHDDVLKRRLLRLSATRGITLHWHASPHFLTPPDFLAERIAGRKKPFMARFYEAQRKRMGLLLEADGSPVGGKWSFDAENRQRLPAGYQPPPEPRAPANRHTREATQYVNTHFADRPGRIDAFRWPVTRADALAWLERFFDERFGDFGRYEDAISRHHHTLHHAAISPALNLGLISPAELVDGALARADGVPLASLEGFLRQVVGWREFLAGIYTHHGVACRRGNFWNFTAPLPRAFYHATTGIPPVDRVLRRVLDDGWCHHIERLMVLGNFMLLCRIHPDEVYRWFLEMFVDAYDWVMVPNVYGMSQFADGGLFTTKPYLSGSNYLLKMSDEPRGSWCQIWDGLFWSFIADHPDFFRSNPRLSMMARTWQNLSAEKQRGHRENAARYLARLHGGETAGADFLL